MSREAVRDGGLDVFKFGHAGVGNGWVGDSVIGRNRVFGWGLILKLVLAVGFFLADCWVVESELLHLGVCTFVSLVLKTQQITVEVGTMSYT